MSSSSKVQTPGSETIGLRQPHRTSGLEGLARMHAGESSTFEHAVIAFDPDLTREQIEAEEQKLVSDDSLKVVSIPERALSLKGHKIQMSLSKIISRFQFRKYWKLSNMQLQIICLQGIHSDANEINVTLVDCRGTVEVPLRTMMTTSNKGERFPFDIDFSITIKDAKHIFLRVTRSTLSVKEKIEWGNLRFSGVVTYSNKPRLSAITEVVGKTLLPQGILKEQIYNPTRQDKRMGQEAVDAMIRIESLIKSETATKRGGVLAQRKAGTLAAGSSGGARMYSSAQLEDVEEESGSPEELAAQMKQKRAEEEMMMNRSAAYSRASEEEHNVKGKGKEELTGYEGSFSTIKSESGILASEPIREAGDRAEDVKTRTKGVGFRKGEPSVIGRAASLRSVASRLSSNNPFAKLIEEEADALDGAPEVVAHVQEVVPMVSYIPYIPSPNL